MVDPLNVRELSDVENSDEEIIMTDFNNKYLKDKAIR